MVNEFTNELPLSLALLFRELWSKSKAEAILRYGVTRDQAERILSYSHSELISMARSGVQVLNISACAQRPMLSLVA